jgi:hypothetical protein
MHVVVLHAYVGWLPRGRGMNLMASVGSGQGEPGRRREKHLTAWDQRQSKGGQQMRHNRRFL